MDKIVKRIVSTNTWAASSDLSPIDLPREGIITEVRVRGDITATLTATAVADCTKRILQNLKIEGDGGRTFLGLSGEQAPRLLNFLNEAEFGVPTLHAPIDVGSTSFKQSFIFHPGSNPKDPFDMTAAIPAQALSTLQAKLTTAAAAVTDAAGNITAGTFYFEVCQILGVPVPATLMTPVGSTLVYAHSANYSDYSKTFDLPAGAWLRRIVMLVQDETATTPVRKDDEVTGVKITLPKTGKVILESKWEDLKMATARRYGLRGWSQEQALGATATTRPGYFGAGFLPAGMVIIDFRDFFDPIYGMDLRGYQTGDVQMGLTIENYTSGDDTLMYFDQLLPVDPQYVGA